MCKWSSCKYRAIPHTHNREVQKRNRAYVTPFPISIPNLLNAVVATSNGYENSDAKISFECGVLFLEMELRKSLNGFDVTKIHKNGSPKEIENISLLTFPRPYKNAITACNVDNESKVMKIIGMCFGFIIAIFTLRLKCDNIVAKLIILRNITSMIANPNSIIPGISLNTHVVKEAIPNNGNNNPGRLDAMPTSSSERDFLF